MKNASTLKSGIWQQLPRMIMNGVGQMKEELKESGSIFNIQLNASSSRSLYFRLMSGLKITMLVFFLACITLSTRNVPITTHFTTVASSPHDTSTWHENQDLEDHLSARSLTHSQLSRGLITSASAPILINGNDDFAQKASENGWPGDGTATNPYIIENLEITTTTSNAFSIINTTVHFIIRDCTASAYTYGFPLPLHGFYLDNVTNGVLENNVVHDSNEEGFFLVNSHDNTLKNNTAHDNGKSGFFLVNSSNNMLENNKVHANQEGFRLMESDDNQFLNNHVFNNSRGFFLESSNGNLIKFNIIENNGNHGVVLDASSTSNTITFNDFIQNNGGSGQALSDSSDNDFDYNYWMDHDSPDSDNDGIVDTPYAIEGSGGLTDPHPLSTPYEIYLQSKSSESSSTTATITSSTDESSLSSSRSSESSQTTSFDVLLAMVFLPLVFLTLRKRKNSHAR